MEGLRIVGRLHDGLALVDVAFESHMSERARAEWFNERGQLLADLGEADAAQAAFREAWIGAEKHRDTQLVLSSMLRLARTLIDSDLAEARSLVAMARARGDNTPPDDLAWKLAMAEAAIDLSTGQQESALAHYEVALAAIRAAPDRHRNDFRELSLQRVIVALLARLGRPELAYARAQELVSTARRTLGDHHPETAEVVLTACDAALILEDAAAVLAGVKIVEKAAGEQENVRVAMQLQLVAAHAEAIEDPISALARLERAIESFGSSPIGDDVEFYLLLSLSQINHRAGRFGAAVEALGQAVERLRLPGALQNPNSVSNVSTLVAEALERAGEPDLAVTLLERALAVTTHQPLDPTTVAMVVALARNEASVGRRESARRRISELRPWIEAETTLHESGLVARASIEQALGDHDAAAAEAAYRRLAADPEPNVRGLVDALLARGEAELGGGNPSAAMASAAAAREQLGTHAGLSSSDLQAIALQADAARAAGNRRAASDLLIELEQACASLAATGPPCGPAQGESTANLVALAHTLLSLRLESPGSG